MKLATGIKRAACMAALDVCIIIACAYIAMLTRWAPAIPDDALSETTAGLYRLIVSYISVFGIFGMYRVQWRSLNVHLLFRQALGCVVGMGVSFGWEQLLTLSQSRRYYLLIAFAFILGGVCGSRVVMKLLRDFRAARMGGQPAATCRLTVSDGEEPGTLLICVDDKPVEAGEEDIADLAARHGVTEIVICLSSQDHAFQDRITGECLATGCFVKRV